MVLIIIKTTKMKLKMKTTCRIKVLYFTLKESWVTEGNFLYKAWIKWKICYKKIKIVSNFKMSVFFLFWDCDDGWKTDETTLNGLKENRLEVENIEKNNRKRLCFKIGYGFNFCCAIYLFMSTNKMYYIRKADSYVQCTSPWIV